MTEPGAQTEDLRVESALLVMAKAPIPGLVKTRLAASVGDETACALYKSLLADAVGRAQVVHEEVSADIIWVHKPRAVDFAQVVREHSRTGTERFADSTCLYHGYGEESLAWQQTAELGWAVKRGYRKVVIVNTDVPLLDADMVIQAFRLLDDHDVAVGPAVDGGYNLLGIIGYWDIVSGMDMSAKTVLTEVVDRARTAGRSVGTLKALNDIDTIEDLAQFVNYVDQNAGLPCVNTVRAIEQLDLRRLCASLVPGFRTHL